MPLHSVFDLGKRLPRRRPVSFFFQRQHSCRDANRYCVLSHLARRHHLCQTFRRSLASRNSWPRTLDNVQWTILRLGPPRPVPSRAVLSRLTAAELQVQVSGNPFSRADQPVLLPLGLMNFCQNAFIA